MKGTYAYNYPDANLYQGPLRAPTVFNFFSGDFIPPDPFFATNSLVAPELQIQSDTMLIRFSNHMNGLLWTNEKNRILQKYQSVKAFGAERKKNQANLVISFDPDLVAFEQALEGDTNGDFSSLDDATKKAAGVDWLISHLAVKTLGVKLSATEHAAYRKFLLTISYKDNKEEAVAMIREAVRFMTTSGLYMVQK